MKRIICILLACTLLVAQTIWAEEQEEENIAGETLTFWLPYLDVVLDDAEDRLQYLKYLGAPQDVLDHVTKEEENLSIGEKSIYQLLEDAKGNYDDISIQGMQTSDIANMTIKSTVFEAVWEMGLKDAFAKGESVTIEKLINKFTKGEFKEEITSFKQAVSGNEKLGDTYDSYKFWVDSVADGVELYDILSSDDPDKVLQVTLCVSDMIVDALDEITGEDDWNGDIKIKLANKMFDFSNSNWDNLMRTQEYKNFVKEHQDDFNRAFAKATVEGIGECLADIPREMRQLGKAIIDTMIHKDDGLTFIDRLLGRTKPTSQVNVYKPNIYLYSEIPIDVSVSFAKQEYLTESIPEYSLGWDTKVYGDGRLICQGGTYNFLFYESLASKALVETKCGWVINGKTREEQLREILQLYKFNEKEIEDFMEFWMGMLESDVDYVMYPQDTETVDRQMPVTIMPSPDKITRIWFAFEVYDEQKIKEPEIEPIEREGFTVVEWGGFFFD